MDSFDAFKAAQKQGWAHFAPLEVVTTIPAARLVRFAGVRPGHKVLDVACGTGVVSVTCARAGADVTSLDLTPELLQRARANAQIAGVNVDFHEGDVERLPFADAQFDVVLSQFGHIFAPRPTVAIAEMLRVLKPGGTIAFSTWPPELFTGRIFYLVASYLPPPPPGVAPAILWGDPDVIRERLGNAVSEIVFERDVMTAPALSPQHYRAATERSVGTTIAVVESLATDPTKLAAFRCAYDEIAADFFRDNHVRQGFLMTRAKKN